MLAMITISKNDSQRAAAARAGGSHNRSYGQNRGLCGHFDFLRQTGVRPFNPTAQWVETLASAWKNGNSRKGLVKAGGGVRLTQLRFAVNACIEIHRQLRSGSLPRSERQSCFLNCASISSFVSPTKRFLQSPQTPVGFGKRYQNSLGISGSSGIETQISTTTW